MLTTSEFDYFIKEADQALLQETGKPMTEYELELAKVVWEVAECAALARAAKISLGYHNLGYNASDVAGTLNDLAGVENA